MWLEIAKYYKLQAIVAHNWEQIPSLIAKQKKQQGLVEYFLWPLNIYLSQYTLTTTPHSHRPNSISNSLAPLNSDWDCLLPNTLTNLNTKWKSSWTVHGLERNLTLEPLPSPNINSSQALGSSHQGEIFNGNQGARFPWNPQTHTKLLQHFTLFWRKFDFKVCISCQMKKFFLSQITWDMQEIFSYHREKILNTASD